MVQGQSVRARDGVHEDVSEGQDDGQSDGQGARQSVRWIEARGTEGGTERVQATGNKGEGIQQVTLLTGRASCGMNRTGQQRNSNGQRVSKE